MRTMREFKRGPSEEEKKEIMDAYKNLSEASNKFTLVMARFLKSKTDLRFLLKHLDINMIFSLSVENLLCFGYSDQFSGIRELDEFNSKHGREFVEAWNKLIFSRKEESAIERALNAK